jgi:Arylsulfotransferase (ASST)
MGMRIGQRVRLATQISLATVLTFGLLAPTSRSAEPDKAEPAKPKLGLLVNEPQACKGYTLLAPTNSRNTYLIDLEGHVVQTWKSDCNPGLSAYFLENGHLLRTGAVRNPPFFGGGSGGRIQEFSWNGDLVWDFTYVNENELPNHDICRLPNGNVLMLVWTKKSSKDAIEAGRRPETVSDSYLLSGSILEVQPTGKTTGKIVWAWHAWDHLIQDFDVKKANHGEVGNHPELIDLNFGDGVIAAMVAKPDELEKLRSIGYVGAAGRKPQRAQADWLHLNAIAYNAELDQIMVSVHEFSEIWTIDHSVKTTEAAGHQGGRYGKGGDLLYRWGNPRAYRAGTVKDQKFFGQHNAHWIDKGLPGEGHVLVFNNGMRRTGGAYSTVDEIVLPVDAKGKYECTPGKAFGPEKAVWTYVAPKRTEFYAPFISGAQRLANGNTLICSGTNGTLFEVNAKEEIVWKYINPEKNTSPIGGGPFGSPPKLGQVLPSFLQGILNLSADQKKQLEAVEKESADKLATLLTDEQKKLFEQRVGFGGFTPAGQLMSSATQARLRLTADQKEQLAEVQKAVDGKLDAFLKDEQKKQLKDMQGMARGIPGGPPGGFPFGDAPKLGQILPSFQQGALKLADEQKKDLEAAEKECAAKLAKLLTDEQKKLFEQRPPFGDFTPAGQLMSSGTQDRLKLTEDQKKQLAEVQKLADGKLEMFLKDDQKKQLRDMAKGPPPGPPGFPGGPPGPGGVPGFTGGFGAPGGGGMFRALRYTTDFAGLAGKELKSGKTIDELSSGKEPPKESKDK